MSDRNLFFGPSECPRCHRDAGRGHKCQDISMEEFYYGCFKGVKGVKGVDDVSFQKWLQHYRTMNSIKGT